MITPAQAMAILGIASRSTFWALIYRLNVPHVRYPGTRIIRFEKTVIEGLRDNCVITGPEDLRKSINGRRLS